MRAASDRIVPVSLELGGKSPSIVFPDANEDWVIDGIIAAMRFTRQSQSCTAGSRLFLHRDILARPRQDKRGDGLRWAIADAE
jgi:acyl-CoA reductase-like NAD-dependent aldehyde dehydrogenase